MPQKHVIEANDLNFATEVRDQPGIVLIDFSARWCGPCKMVDPLVEKVARDQQGRVRVAKLDIDDSPGVATEFAIRGAPTFVVLSDGKEIRRHTGALAERGLLSLIAP